jgi:methylglyoxal reductase
MSDTAVMEKERKDVASRKLGHTDIDASVVGLGTWAIGGWRWGGTDEDESIAAINAALDNGVSLIDTAPAYGMGRSEEIVGRAIEGRRDEVVLATKCGLVWHTQQGNHFFDNEGTPVHRHLGADSVRYELEQSLARLRTDYIDLYITHWQDPTTPVAETMGTLMELKAEGKIRAIGISNVSPEDLVAYVAEGPVDAIQEKYSMLDRDIESTLLPMCAEHGVSTLSYSSLALGLLSGKIGPDRTFNGDDLRIGDPRFSMANREKIASLFDEIRPIANDLDVTLAQLVIAWTVSQPGITYSLCGARNPAQATENAIAGSLSLTADQISQTSVAVDRYLKDMDA